ncbi:ABC transporter substrate-binding protein [Rhizobium sp. CRIBSB]|uniref:NitT/TauT family transport system substrate-binding protein n=1 Tax=Peteryoungia aggregata LMG 23059 TaxID=1368425 RepID=A0ABU0G5Y5_9HYPH|nr:putative urea ABC transporter substrate-binding protein [Peteryoungia aggregata]MDQ0420753.1 NitT/TauT family transport system substrate-binding protein [Peteryoungia aggregata LMG 23059]NBB48463.1 ABC transporter substrate-binding protein [Rhizobium sp. CRIBSB]
MTSSLRAIAQSITLAAALAVASILPAQAAGKTSFKVGYTIYVGFMPMGYMKESGILKKWADKYGIEIEMLAVNDYVGSINQFIAGDLDAVGVAGMDALTMPAAGGVDTSIFLITDYSNGNDVLMSKSATSVADLKGQDVYLVEYSVSHYLLNRALVMNGLSGVGEVKTINISDADIAAAYLANPDMQNAAAWKPMSADMLAGSTQSKVLFDSAQIPGEIMDVFIGNTQVLKDNPAFGKALTGAWYETLAALKAGGAEAKPVNDYMASALGTDEAGLKTQIDTTFFFYTPAEAATFLTDAKTGIIMDDIRKFSFDRGLFGQGATSVDAIGIELADGTVLGDPANIKLRIDASYARLGAEGGL